MEIKTRKIGIVGVGHVGAHCAFSLAIQGLADELVLVDLKEEKMTAEVQDIRDAAMFFPHRVIINRGTYADLGDCDIIVNAVGAIAVIGTDTHLDRTIEMEYTIHQVREMMPKIMASGFNGIIISISNPCDVVTGIVAELSSLPKGHVFGTGTGLDSSRLISELSLQTGVDHKAINAHMLGEHGMSQMAAWSCVTFGGVPLSVLEKTDERFVFDHEEMRMKATQGGFVTYRGKQCTEYGICAVLARDVRCVLHDEKCIVPASMLLDGEYGEHDVFAGVPCVIGKNGVERVLELPLTEAEKAELHACCDIIRANMEKAKHIQ